MATTSSSSTAGLLPVLAGVYVAKAHQLLIGPLVHLENFVTGSTGAAFPNSVTVLPPPSLRYVVDCAPHLSDLPLLPDYATVPSLMENVSARASSPENRRDGEVLATSPQYGQHQQQQPLKLVTPTSLTTSPEVCPAMTWPSSTPVDHNVKAHPDRNHNSINKNGVDEEAGKGTSARLSSTTTPATPTAPTALSTSEVIRRMNKNAEECFARLRQRCVLNGMSTMAFSPIRQANFSLPQSSFTSLNSSPILSVRAQVTSEAVKVPTAVPAAVEDCAPEVSATTKKTLVPLPKMNVELFTQAKLNDEARDMAIEKLGGDHVLRCLIPNTDDSLASPSVQETILQIKTIFDANADAQVYIYSLDGKGTASALAGLYLLEVDRVALSEVLLQRLPVCTPRMSCLVQLVERDPHPESFDKSSYLRLYLARRYPSASTFSIEAAVSTCKANYSKAERLVRMEVSFQRVDDVYMPSQDSRRSGSTGGTASNYYYMQSPFDMSSLRSNNNNSSSTAVNRRVNGGDDSLSEFSLCSSFAKDPVRLTEGDDRIIDSLYRALADSRVGVSRDDVKESYIQHHRSQDLVLRQFLLRFRASDLSATSPRNRPYNRGYGNLDSGCVTPTADFMEEISLPQFTLQPASRRGSMMLVSTPTVTKKATPGTETCPSPEPSLPSINSAPTSKDTPVKTVSVFPRSEQQTTLLATSTVTPDVVATADKDDSAVAAVAVDNSAPVRTKKEKALLPCSATTAGHATPPKSSAVSPKPKGKSGTTSRSTIKTGTADTKVPLSSTTGKAHAKAQLTPKLAKTVKKKTAPKSSFKGVETAVRAP